jgi:hypothetical protein
MKIVRTFKRVVIKPHAFLFVLFSAALFAIQTPLAHSALDDLLKGVEKVLGGKGLSDSEIIQGLKQALEIGTENAVQQVSQLDGYFGNPAIRIPLPGVIQDAEKIVRLAGYGSELDELLLSMNRAAERAAPEAKAIFWDAIKKMSFSDAREILEGRDNEATLYFKDRTSKKLGKTFEPIVHTAMSEVGVTRAYQDLDAKVKDLPLVGDLSYDLDKYVTDGALDGLFHVVGEEERKIRQDPAARVTDLLKKVFDSGS